MNCLACISGSEPAIKLLKAHELFILADAPPCVAQNGDGLAELGVIGVLLSIRLTNPYFDIGGWSMLSNT
jgi:hypothetical protein